MEPFTLHDFIRESNSIEGIEREPTEAEISEAQRFLSREVLTIDDLRCFVRIYQPGAQLRSHEGMNVRVGKHIPPPGGAGIIAGVSALLWEASMGHSDAYTIHARYEVLHPFTDGNGRSGRMLWLWQMGGIENAPLGFLHHFYYQTLANSK